MLLDVVPDVGFVQFAGVVDWVGLVEDAGVVPGAWTFGFMPVLTGAVHPEIGEAVGLFEVNCRLALVVILFP